MPLWKMKSSILDETTDKSPTRNGKGGENVQNLKVCNNLISYSGNNIGFVSNGTCTLDVMFQNQEIQTYFETKRLRVVWKPDIFTRLLDSAGQFAGDGGKIARTVRIWRMKNDFPTEAKFLFLDDLRNRFGEPKISDFEAIYQEEMGTENLDLIFKVLSEKDLYEDLAYPLSISDVIELYDQECHVFYYIDRYDFVEIPFHC